MKFFGDAASKVLWGIVILLAVGAGLTWFIRGVLSPPDLSANNAGNTPTSTVTSPDDSDPAKVTTVQESEPTSVVTTDDNTVSGDEPMPAIAQAEDVVMEVPERVEKGGILKLYTNNDGNEYPDPIQYSPEKILKTTGLSLIGNGEQSKFQEVSGYLLVKEDGNYNFVIDYPEDWNYWARKREHFRTRVDGQTLPTSKGGRLTLEKGWHTISVFLYAYRVDASAVRVSWGREGEPLKPLQIWREADGEVAQKPSPKPTSSENPVGSTSSESSKTPESTSQVEPTKKTEEVR
ncbi:MAG: hypothetical protein HC820_00195 [Hydrococcus sp. RM1_1_31]|nr:hypothetical protein [Hydrococcus sp. RM1_1_31]